jgi:hypothetical protein
MNQGMIQVVGRNDFLLAKCFLAKTTLPGFHSDQPAFSQTVRWLENFEVSINCQIQELGKVARNFYSG